ncbi:MAG: hypothetical protein NWE88_11200, partial [Candidatus Bathyarchaeota archaeon]|nr:hypothetical protein [Candidatus Bathyarchaeota archaeon]
EVLKIKDEKKFRIHVIEVLSDLVLMIHWLRGMLTWLEWTKTVTFSNPEHRKNYLRLANDVDDHSEYVWEVVAPRAMMAQLRLWRRHGYLEPDFKKLLAQDRQGRFPVIPDSGDKHTKEGAEAREVFIKVLTERDLRRANE